MAKSVDLTKVNADFNYNAFKNNHIYTGQFNIVGSWTPGYQTQTHDVLLTETPDLVQATFNGPTDTVFGSDPRPGEAWFKNGAVWVRGDNAGAGYTNYPIPYEMSAIMTGPRTCTINASSVSEIADTLTLTPTTVYFRVLDYSVF